MPSSNIPTNDQLSQAEIETVGAEVWQEISRHDIGHETRTAHANGEAMQPVPRRIETPPFWLHETDTTWEDHAQTVGKQAEDLLATMRALRDEVARERTRAPTFLPPMEEPAPAPAHINDIPANIAPPAPQINGLPLPSCSPQSSLTPGNWHRATSAQDPAQVAGDQGVDVCTQGWARDDEQGKMRVDFLLNPAESRDKRLFQVENPGALPDEVRLVYLFGSTEEVRRVFGGG